MNTPETFGPFLRRARIRRGVSLADLAQQTNVSIEMWEQMEASDFSAWPSGLYARAWIRAYAEAIGVDPEETVNDFCRWFPQGDRRAERRLRAQAAIVGHDLEWRDDLVPPDGDRRAVASPPPDAPIQPRRLRLAAAGLDFAIVVIAAAIAVGLLPLAAWPVIAAVAELYHGNSVAALGCTPAVWLLDTYAATHPEVGHPRTVSWFRRLPSSSLKSQRSTPN
jgi:transcriptional regulator with XRE-family HTH domain